MKRGSGACITVIGVAFFALTILDPSAAYGARVKSVQKNGLLHLEDGRLISLAGIEISREGVHLLPILVADKNLEFEQESEQQPRSNGTISGGYVFVSLSELSMPFKKDVLPLQNRVMLNELLLSLGAARVKTDRIFKYKDNFDKIEAEAKRKGEGIWSYAKR